MQVRWNEQQQLVSIHPCPSHYFGWFPLSSKFKAAVSLNVVLSVQALRHDVQVIGWRRSPASTSNFPRTIESNSSCQSEIMTLKVLVYKKLSGCFKEHHLVFFSPFSLMAFAIHWTRWSFDILEDRNLALNRLGHLICSMFMYFHCGGGPGEEPPESRPDGQPGGFEGHEGHKDKVLISVVSNGMTCNRSTNGLTFLRVISNLIYYFSLHCFNDLLDYFIARKANWKWLNVPSSKIPTSKFQYDLISAQGEALLVWMG